MPIRLVVVSWPAPNSRPMLAAQLLGRELVARLLGAHQLGGEVVLRLAAAQLAELVEIDAGHLGVAGWPGRVSSRLIGTGSRMRPLTLLPARNGARCSSGMPSMSQITITGRRWARSRMTSISPLSITRSSCSSTSCLDARPHVGDAAGGEGLGHQAAQARVVGRVEHQHGAARGWRSAGSSMRSVAVAACRCCPRNPCRSAGRAAQKPRRRSA